MTYSRSKNKMLAMLLVFLGLLILQAYLAPNIDPNFYAFVVIIALGPVLVMFFHTPREVEVSITGLTVRGKEPFFLKWSEVEKFKLPSATWGVFVFLRGQDQNKSLRTNRIWKLLFMMRRSYVVVPLFFFSKPLEIYEAMKKQMVPILVAEIKTDFEEAHARHLTSYAEKEGVSYEEAETHFISKKPALFKLYLEDYGYEKIATSLPRLTEADIEGKLPFPDDWEG